MKILCPIHGETEGYDAIRGGYFSKCKLCTREKACTYRLQKAKGTFQPKARVYATEATHVRDPWLTCNQQGCGQVCKDRHELYLHKTKDHGPKVIPDDLGLIQSTLRQA